ncbi:hypothetical protein EV421DRAFT_1742380 [Armillaria borealis]|uniref:Uncharacterized protein n=1 Tax=Armillaria borealis TaxID=47425 RepID=A0AA39MFF8_9AGAR|nr:hypothetical protein EV421DRAFT_1742380 [Armillaria borealis]
MEGSRDVSGERVQKALCRMMEGYVVTVHIEDAKNDIYHVDTSNVLFILIKQRICQFGQNYFTQDSDLPHPATAHHFIEMISPMKGMMPFTRYFKLEEHDKGNAKSYAAVVAMTSANGWRTSLGTNEMSMPVFVIMNILQPVSFLMAIRGPTPVQSQDAWEQNFHRIAWKADGNADNLLVYH